MTLWRDGDWLRFVWNTGIQYVSIFSVRLPLEEAHAKIRLFYESRGCRVVDESVPSRIEFRRGSRFISKLSPILVHSEKWLDHSIRIGLTGSGEFTEVSASYDARAWATVCAWPMSFAQESRELERLLANDFRRRPRFALREFAMGLAAGAILTIVAMCVIGLVVDRYRYERYEEFEPKFSSLGERLSEMTLKPNGTHDAYGIILNADDSDLHLRNVSLAYTTLLHNGYAPENIFVFSCQDTEESADDDSEAPEFQTHAPTYGNLDMFFEQFVRKVVDNTDYLTVYATGHGTSKGRTSEVVLRDDYSGASKSVSSTELDALLGEVQPAQAVFIFDQCHGGFDGAFQMDNYLVISRSMVTETGSCKHFAKHLLEQLDPDKAERKVSLGEAFDMACTFDEDYRNGIYTPTMTGPLRGTANEVFLSAKVEVEAPPPPPATPAPPQNVETP